MRRSRVPDIFVVVVPERIDGVYLFMRREDAEGFHDAVSAQGAVALLSQERVHDPLDAERAIAIEGHDGWEPTR